MGLFYHFSFEMNHDFLKSKSPWFLLKKKVNFNKKETESKVKKFHIHISGDEPSASIQIRTIN